MPTDNPDPTIPQLLAGRLADAVARFARDGQPAGFAPSVSQATDPRFGDYQTNAAMVMGKAVKENPRLVAERLVDLLKVSDLCEKPEIAGPGFINFRLKPAALAARTHALLSDPKLGVASAAHPLRVVVDFSAPNIAKPMHIGHLRSTIIGDCLARVARFTGRHVITDNHIGDWGTQFGMIIHGWKSVLDHAALEADPIAELVRVYRAVNTLAEHDERVREECKEELVKLQAGDPENLAIWRRCVDLSLEGLREIYSWLGVHFDHYLGESHYNDRLAPLVESLLAAGIAEESDGAVCVFFRDHPDLKDSPAIIRKADGGFLYATTDLATIDFRATVWGADDAWYVVGAPQSLHFQQVFETARRRGQAVRLVHVAHGSILGRDRKLMRTRTGESVGLLDVLKEAVERARAIVEEKNPTLGTEEKAAVARAVGLGAVKYAELSQNRMTDYVFDWDKMLSLTGDTAPYLQYSHVRARSIFRKLGQPMPETTGLVIADSAERALALKLCQFSEAVPDVLADHRPNILANYLLELARLFHSFFEACPVLRAEGETRLARLALCELTARTLKSGLDLMGIEAPERM